MKYLKNGACKLFLPLILAMLCVLFASSVSAELSIDPLAKATYNLGDKIFVSGTIIGKAAEQNLAFELVCADKAHPLSARLVYLIPGKSTSFSERFSVPRSASGSCFVRGILSYASGNSSVSDLASSTGFFVAKDLAASLLINSSKIQLGQDSLLTGLVTKLDSTPVTGVAKINFKKDDVVYFSEDLDLTNGVVYFPINSSLFVSASKLPAGNYYVVVSAFDVYGNEQEFEMPFFVSDSLLLEASLNKKEYLPGDRIVISGMAAPEIAAFAESASVRIELDEYFLKTDVSKNKFSYTLALPGSIKSGSHTIVFFVSDKYGNHGTSEAYFYVIPVPSLVMIEPNKRSYKPEEAMSVKSFVYDQASELTNGSVIVYLLSPDSKVIFNSTTVSGGLASFELPKFFAPGVYTLRALISDKQSVFAELKVNVEGVEEVQLSFSNSTVSVLNTGNVNYEKVLTITAVDSNNQTYYLNKKLTLAPSKSTEISLDRELPSGEYSVVLPEVSGQDAQFVSSVNLSDERSLLKKTADGLSSLTSLSVVGAYSVEPTSSIRLMRQIAFFVFIVVVAGCVAAGVYFRKSARRSYSHHEAKASDEKASISDWIERKIEEEKIVKEGVAQDDAAGQVNKMLREKRQAASEKEKEAAEREAVRKDPYVRQFVKRSLGDEFEKK